MTNAEENEMMNCECIAEGLKDIVNDDGASLDSEDRETLQRLRDKYNERFTVLHAKFIERKNLSVILSQE